MIACVVLSGPAPEGVVADAVLLGVAQQFSPRVAWMAPGVLALDLTGLTRLFGDARAVGEQLRRMLAAAGLRAHIAIAGTRTAARLLAQARAGLTVTAPGEEAAALAPLPIALIAEWGAATDIASAARPPARFYRTSPVQELVRPVRRGAGAATASAAARTAADRLAVFRRWGLRTLGDLAALPAADLAARVGRDGPRLQALARGHDVAPLVPVVAEERFQATLALEWPIEELEPLSFVVSRLFEPVCAQLDRRGRAAAIVHVELRLVTRQTWARRLELPAPMKDARTLRTLVLLDLESHPPPAAIDAVTVRVEPTPARTMQHSLLERARPAPEQISTLTARLAALMGERRVGTPVLHDTHRPDAFEMVRFTGDPVSPPAQADDRPDAVLQERTIELSPGTASDIVGMTPALRRYRPPVLVRVVVDQGRPVQLRGGDAGLPGGAVQQCAGPWRASGDWWATDAAWDRDEWDVAVAGIVCRLFRDRRKNRWFVDGVYD